MDFCTNFFGKKLEDLNLNDIINFFRESQLESDKIEFKAFGTGGNINDKYRGVFKNICAFLNSSGGIFIWGAPEGRNDTETGNLVFQGQLSPIDHILEKDRLINRISDSITPTPNYVNINIIEDNGNCICVIEIQKSIDITAI